MRRFTYPLTALALVMSAKLACADPYVSVGAGAIKSLSISNDDPVEFGTDPWFVLTMAAGDDALVTVEPVDIGGELELGIVPDMPQHGDNTGKGAANHGTADGQSVTLASVMVNVEPQVHLWDGVRAYIVGGGGLGYGNSGVGTGPAYQGGAGVKYDITNAATADLSFRYRDINGVKFVGPELRFTWNFDSPFGLGSKGPDEK